MSKSIVVAGVTALALFLSACESATPEGKMTGACLRLNKDANSQSNCTCMVSKLKEKITPDEMSALADTLNGILDQANGNGEAAGQAIGIRVRDGTLVNSKVGVEFLGASKTCAMAGTASPPAPAPAPAP